MVNGKTKRIVIIKDIHSNIIEEAIIILKNDIDTSKFHLTDKGKQSQTSTNSKFESDYLMNEARLIINNYIKECKTQAEERNGFNKKNKDIKRKISSGLIINLGLTSIILFLLMLVFDIIKFG